MMTDDIKPQEESLMKFPCDFTIKVIGAASNEFEAAVLMIIHKHVANLSDRAIQTRPSENGKYLALSITFNIDSQDRLDDIYRELSSCPLVLMAL